MLSSAIVASSVVSSERAITRHLVGFAREGSSQRMRAMRCAHNGRGFEDFADATLRVVTFELIFSWFRAGICGAGRLAGLHLDSVHSLHISCNVDQHFTESCLLPCQVLQT